MKDGKISKAEAVRQAISQGVTSPGDAVEYIKKTYGIEITKAAWSVYRSQALAKMKKGGGVKAAVKKVKATSAKEAAAPKSGKVMNHNAADLAKAVRKLVETYGATAVKDMAAVFAE